MSCSGCRERYQLIMEARAAAVSGDLAEAQKKMREMYDHGRKEIHNRMMKLVPGLKFKDKGESK